MAEKVIAEVKTGKSKEEVAFDLFAYAGRSSITDLSYANLWCMGE